MLADNTVSFAEREWIVLVRELYESTSLHRPDHRRVLEVSVVQHGLSSGAEVRRNRESEGGASGIRI
jgi:hypothetical protein